MEQAKANVCNAMPRANISQIAGKVCTGSLRVCVGGGAWQLVGSRLTALAEQTFLKACIDFSDLCVRSNQAPQQIQAHPVISSMVAAGPLSGGGVALQKYCNSPRQKSNMLAA